MGQFDQVGHFDDGTDGVGREAGQAAAQGAGAWPAVTAEQRRQQGFVACVDVLRAATAPPGQHQPDEDQGERRDTAGEAGESVLQSK